ncbi:MAG: tetratricopeptide repeat protein, partial [Candidatus Zixiibacteriota bacterium]
PDNEAILSNIAAIENRLRLERQQQIERQLQVDMTLDAELYYTQAQKFHDRKQYRTALDMIDLTLSANPEHDEAKALQAEIRDAMSTEIVLNMSLADSAWRSGGYLTAIEAYDRILDVDPEYQPAISGRQAARERLGLIQQLQQGIELFRRGKYQAARQNFAAILAVDESDPVSRDYIRRIDEALAKPPTLEEIQQDEPIWQLYLKGLHHMREKEYQKAIDAWEKVLQAYPNNPNTLDNLEQARLRLQSEQGR